MKKILILGSSGSIGVNTLNVIRNFPDKFSVVGLTVNSRIDVLERQIKEFKPEFVVVTDESKAKELQSNIGNLCEVLSGYDELLNAASQRDYDILLGSMVGFAGLAPTLEAIKRGKRIALANKETLVVAGELVTKLVLEIVRKYFPLILNILRLYQCLVP